MTVRVVIGQGQLGKKEARFGRELRSERLRAMHAVGRAGVRMLAFASRDIKDRGSFQVGWRYQAAFTRLEFFNKERHALFVERGRQPGGKMPPLAPIRAWVARRGLPARMAWPIARKIAAKGIRARPVLERADLQKTLRQVYGAAMIGAVNAAARRAAK